MRPQRMGTRRAVEPTQATCMIRVRDSEVERVAYLLSSFAPCLIPVFPKVSFALTRVVGTSDGLGKREIVLPSSGRSL